MYTKPTAPINHSLKEVASQIQLALTMIHL